MRWTVPGKNIAYRAISAFLILPKFLELVLNKGIDKFSGKQLGAVTPDPLTFTSIDDVIDACLEHVKFFMDKVARLNNIIDVFYKEELPRPFLSPLMDGCIEKAKDCRQWSYFYKTIIGPMGQSGQPAHPHYDDMIEPWINVTGAPLYFDKSDVLQHAKEILFLEK